MAYFKMVNEQGGINGRKVTLVSLDNAFSPPKALEVTRQLVESDKVLAIAGFLGTSPNASVQKYLNDKKVPNLFLTSGAERFNDPKHFPWIVPLYPTYVGQGEIFAKFILAKDATAKIGVLYVNDDLGKDFLKGLKRGLGERGKMIVREVSHEFTDPSVDNQIIDLKGSGADVLIQLTYAKFAAQGMRKAFELGWKPEVHILASVASSIGGALIPAGIPASKGIITARWEKLPTDPSTAKDPDVVDYLAFYKEIHAGELQHRGQHSGAGLHQLLHDNARANSLR
jgi:branched-chain amino acid transport system substrate-binding protein